MAMTKKEQAELESLREELRIARAFRFTEKAEKDVPPPESSCGEKGLTYGYDFNEHVVAGSNYANESGITHHWSGSVNHGTMPYSKHSGSQNSKSLFSSRLLALRALRHALERRFAKTLAGVDKMIEKELVDGGATQ